MSERGNLVDQVRPGSTFENFEIYDDVQGEAVGSLEMLADSIVEKQSAIVSQEYPFDAGRIIFLWSPPGRGKSHLVEAIVNRIRQRAPKLIECKHVYLSRYEFTLEHIASVYTYQGAPVVIIDDMFSDKQSIDQLSAYTDVKCVMGWVASVYERRTLALCTSNFPMMDGIAKMVQQVDKIGRTASRLQELLANSGEIELPGRDYRVTVASKRDKSKLFKV